MSLDVDLFRYIEPRYGQYKAILETAEQVGMDEYDRFALVDFMRDTFGPDREVVHTFNITHNLADMAAAAGCYDAMWRPDEIGATRAGDLIGPLESAVAALKSAPAKFLPLNPPNGWGNFQGLLRTVEDYLVACRRYPDALIEVSR